jgi:hypothetical protein
LLVRAPEPEVDRRVEIIDPSSGHRVVTAIEVLSPSNKLPGRARTAYESKQRAITHAYERGRYDRTDYRRPLDPPLAFEDAAWAEELLRRVGRL